MSAAGKDLKLTELYTGVIPFVVIELIVIAVLIKFQILSTWLPSTMH